MLKDLPPPPSPGHSTTSFTTLFTATAIVRRQESRPLRPRKVLGAVNSFLIRDKSRGRQLSALEGTLSVVLALKRGGGGGRWWGGGRGEGGRRIIRGVQEKRVSWTSLGIISLFYLGICCLV